jgi:hypothetical protein
VRSPRLRTSLLLLLLGLWACARGPVLPAAPTALPSPSPTALPPSATASPTFTPSPTATASVTPTPTDTPLPSATPVPTAEIQLRQGAAEVAYVVPLTVQHLTPNAALVLFQLERPSPGYLVYRAPPATSSVWMLRPLDAEVARHRITLMAWCRTDATRSRLPWRVSFSLARRNWPGIRGR